MSTTSTTSAATLFIDLATYSELEGFLYGGPESITYFVRTVQKANWFAFLPVTLRIQSSLMDFNQKNSAASVNRSGDYVLNVWFRAQIPQIVLVTDGTVATGLFTDSEIRWTRNLAHNLFDKISISFNELVVHEMDSYWLDVNYEFRLPFSKRTGYQNMIGDVAFFTSPVGPSNVTAGAPILPLGDGRYIQCPIPFWFCEDSGVALPAAALPFNDIKVNYNFRDWTQLIVLNPGTNAVGGPGGMGTGRPATYGDIFQLQTPSKPPALVDAQTFAHYAVVHNDERVKMGDAPRDILICQTQEVSVTPFKDVSTPSTFDIRLSHAIGAFFFMAQNYSLQGEWSNYTTEPEYAGLDPIAFSVLIYENTPRIAMGSDYFALTVPFYFSTAIPFGGATGLHMGAFGIRPWEHNPTASTNFSKLANVSIQHTMSASCIAAANTTNPVDSFGNPIVYPNSAGVVVPFPQIFRHIFLAKNWNIARVANGSLGHPTL